MVPPYNEIATSSLGLRLSQAAFKTSHNAYEIDKVSLAEQMDWSPARPDFGGCRGMEFDVHQEQTDSSNWRWSVSHGGGYDSDPDNQLSAYLRAVGRWAATPDQVHGPMLIHIDLKDTFGLDSRFPDQIDTYIRDALPGIAFFSSTELLGGTKSLLEAVTAKRWPTVGDLQGKILVCLTGGQTSRTNAYINSLVAGDNRLCFCDREITDQLTLGTKVRVSDEPNRLILNFDMMSGACKVPTPDQIDNLDLALLRAYALPPSLWNDAVNSGANLLAMDILKFGSMNVDPPLYAPAIGR